MKKTVVLLTVVVTLLVFALQKLPAKAMSGGDCLTQEDKIDGIFWCPLFGGQTNCVFLGDCKVT